MRGRRVELRGHGAGCHALFTQLHGPRELAREPGLDGDESPQDVRLDRRDVLAESASARERSISISRERRVSLLADEANRPVFVSPTSIVPATGSVSTIEARTTAAYGRVSERVSDLRGDARQLSVYAIPNMRFNWGIAIFGYTLADARTQLRGFDANTAGDPRVTEWSPIAFTPTHQFTFQYSRFWFGGNFGMGLGLRTSTGVRFTPTVAGDISGDGAIERSRLPLRSIDGARRLACQRIAFAPRDRAGSSARLPERAARTHRGAQQLRRPVVHDDERQHRAEQHSAHEQPRARVAEFRERAWRARSIAPRQRRICAAGGPFRCLTRRSIRCAASIRRTANSSTRSTRASAHRVRATTTRRNPFRLTLDVQLDLGRSVPEQQVEQNLRVRPSLYGTRATADTIKARYMRSQFSDFYTLLLRNADSLALSRNQTEQLQAEQMVLRARADSIFGEMAKTLTALPENYDVQERR